MKFLVVGIGACGNKVGINLVEKGIIAKEDLVLINSTIKDIPEEYKQKTIRFKSEYEGAGQERNRGRDMAVAALQNEEIKFEQIIQPDHEKVVIITSLSGGTGSGASVIIAKWLKDIIKIPVEIIGMVGFSDESVRAFRNIVEFCQDLEEGYSIQLIRNDAFLKAANGSRLRAEALANDEVARRVALTGGNLIVESKQNIDDTDLLKLDTTSGYKSVEFIEVKDKIKTPDQFNELINNALNETKSFDLDGLGMTRLGVILNLREESLQNVDYSYHVIKDRVGVPYEVFNHIETLPDTGEFIGIICAGLQMPIEEIKDIYNEYKRETANVNKKQDSFFSEMASLKGDDDDFRFDMQDKREIVEASKTEKENFFQAFRNTDSGPIPTPSVPKETPKAPARPVQPDTDEY